MNANEIDNKENMRDNSSSKRTSILESRLIFANELESPRSKSRLSSAFRWRVSGASGGLGLGSMGAPAMLKASYAGIGNVDERRDSN